jgi:hypothetical protein
MSETEVTREAQRGIRLGIQAVPGSSVVRRWGKRRHAEQPMVPRAEFTPYYGKPVINALVWVSPDTPATCSSAAWPGHPRCSARGRS